MTSRPAAPPNRRDIPGTIPTNARQNGTPPPNRPDIPGTIPTNARQNGTPSGGPGAVASGAMRRIAVLVVGALLLAGCVGTVDRSDFEAEIQARGGGFDQAMVIDAVDGVAARVGTDEFEITRLTANPMAGLVTMQVRDPRAPDQLDDYTFRRGSLESVDPVQVSAADDLDADAFPIAGFALDRLDDMVDDALDAYDTDGGYVDGVSLVRVGTTEAGQGVGAVQLQLESPRSSAVARFTPGGELISLERQ